MTLRGLLCTPSVRLMQHEPELVLCSVYRCAQCGAVGTVLELGGDRDARMLSGRMRPAGYVPTERRRFARDDRYRAGV